MLYARESAENQADAGNLERQLGRLREYAREKGYRVAADYPDLASGLNHNRRVLERVLKTVEGGEFKKLLMEYPYRLARFRHAFLERHLKYCTSQKETEDAHTELVQDLLAIVASFPAQLYGAMGRASRS
jgi:predicted site-specific integrase-resolvase